MGLFGNSNDENYKAICRQTFGKELSPLIDWFFFPFDFTTPEGKKMMSFVWGIEIEQWGKFLETLKNEGIEGDLVEFGVAGGNSLNRLIGFCEDLKLSPQIYGFDSFEGLPERSDADPDFWYKGKFATDFQAVADRLKMKKRKNLHLVKGWFCDTLALPEIQEAIKKVSFARIDCDLYQSTVDCLNFLDGRFADGAFLCFDDWTHNPEQGETKAFLEFCERTADRYRFEHVMTISLGGCHFRVRRID